MGAYSFAMLPPALNRAMSIPSKLSRVNSATVWVSFRNLSFLPTDRALASSVSFPTGNWRFSSVLSISMPTAPVAPTTATCGLRFIKSGNIAEKAGQSQRSRGLNSSDDAHLDGIDDFFTDHDQADDHHGAALAQAALLEEDLQRRLDGILWFKQIERDNERGNGPAQGQGPGH